MEFLHSLDDAREAAVAHCGGALPAGTASVRRLWRGLVASYPDFALPRHLRWLAESGQLEDGRRFLIATLSVGCETKQASAARPKWRSRATATM